MKIKLDENMPLALARLLLAAGHDVETVMDENLVGATDELVLRKATAEGRILMTLDCDFADIRAYPIGTHAGIVVFRIPDQRWAVLRESAERLLAAGRLDHLSMGLAVVDQKRIRMRLKN